VLIKIGDTGRLLSNAQPEPNPALAVEGWERRFTADPDRAREAAELYRKLGYEVRAEAVRPAEFRDECGGCHQVALRFQTIYTRKWLPDGGIH
jgi:hypothetical protein